ncbi:MAG: hypothetical protein ACLP5H_17795 [Desulfomonilaceae bacterium]
MKEQRQQFDRIRVCDDHFVGEFRVQRGATVNSDCTNSPLAIIDPAQMTAKAALNRSRI